MVIYISKVISKIIYNIISKIIYKIIYTFNDIHFDMSNINKVISQILY